MDATTDLKKGQDQDQNHDRDYDHETADKQSILAKSAHGAKFLIVLQIGSRALTFAANQVLLRFISPDLLGISTQLDIYANSVLFFAREALRVAIQRQTDSPRRRRSGSQDAEGPREEDTPGKTQALVNLAYISICLGVVFAAGLAWAYMRSLRSSPLVRDTPCFSAALQMYAVAAVVELLAEPCFVVVQQRSEYRIRAVAESVGALLRCLATCASIILAARRGVDMGAMPFAFGQWAYALSVLCAYLWKVSAISSTDTFSLLPKPLRTIEHSYMSYFSKPILSLGTSLFVQGVVKHMLTQGDVLMISSFASLSAQGIYAMASNYGGLVARMVFQPIEESSRNYFGKLLSSIDGQLTHGSIRSANEDLHRLLRVYTLIGVSAAVVGPTAAPMLLNLVVGSRWTSTGAGDVLAKYCYYIPLLAYNGLLEAFVSVVATESQLNRQSLWMLAFSAAFAGTGYAFLRVLDLGAQGLVYANMANMLVRIAWSGSFIDAYLRKGGAGLSVAAISPKFLTWAAAAGTASVLQSQKKGASFKDFAMVGLVSTAFLLLLYVNSPQTGIC